MCKKSFLNKLKDAAKSIPLNVDQIKKSTVERANSMYESASMDKILSKTKQELAQKQQTFKQYADKIRNVSQSQGKDLMKKTEELKDSASEIKNNLNLGEASSRLKQKILEYASPIKKQQPLKQLPKNQPKPQYFSVFNMAQRILQKAQKLQDHFTTNMIVQNTRSVFAKILSNMYWKFLFALCLVTLIYVSPQLIKQIGQISLQLKKMQKQDQKEKAKSPP